MHELDHEWDVERVLETNAGVLTLSAMALGLIFKPLRILPAVVAGFLVQHAVQGWCPPVPVVRRMGVRTTYEIALERYALKALRGDFKGVESEQDPCIKSAKALAAACANGSPFQSDLL